MTMKSLNELREHAHAIARAFNVRLVELADLKPEDAACNATEAIAVVSPITDETTYAVALHEIGHAASPTGFVRRVAEGDVANLKRFEEASAWAWARHYALDWTPVMESVAVWAEGTYQQPLESPAPQAPVAPPSINWSIWK